jgi:hypothetical protein
VPPRPEVVDVTFRQRGEQRPKVGRPDRGAGGAVQVQHLVADGDADAPGLAVAAKAPERQVLDRKVGVGRVGRGDPAAQRRVVRGVEFTHGLNASFSPDQQSA